MACQRTYESIQSQTPISHLSNKTPRKTELRHEINCLKKVNVSCRKQLETGINMEDMKVITCDWCLQERQVVKIEQELLDFWLVISVVLDPNIKSRENICYKCNARLQDFLTFIEECKSNGSLIEKECSAIESKEDLSIDVTDTKLIKEEIMEDDVPELNEPSINFIDVKSIKEEILEDVPEPIDPSELDRVGIKEESILYPKKVAPTDNFKEYESPATTISTTDALRTREYRKRKKFENSTTPDAVRMREYRARKKLNPTNAIPQPSSDARRLKARLRMRANRERKKLEAAENSTYSQPSATALRMRAYRQRKKLDNIYKSIDDGNSASANEVDSAKRC